MKQLTIAWLAFLACWNALADTNTVYFLLTSSVDSFALPLSRAEDIAYARRLMSEPDNHSLHRIIIAKIAAGRDGINRNYLRAGAPEWSWHVEKFMSFSDGTDNAWGALSIDTNPSDYAELYGGIIGFPDKVIAELGSVLSLTMQVQGGNIQFEWNIDPYNLYTLEETESLVLPQWTPVAGARWPYPTNRFIMPKASVPLRSYYRVKAQPTPPFWGPP